MDDIIDAMILSVRGLYRVESCLFYEVEGVPVKTINTMLLSEECVKIAKSKVVRVIDANCQGPFRLVVVFIFFTCIELNLVAH